MGLAKLIALLMVLLLVGSSFIGLIIYFLKMNKSKKIPVTISFLETIASFIK